MRTVNAFRMRITAPLSLLLSAFTAALPAGCATLQQNMAESKQAHIIAGKQIHLTDMNGSYRFCEIGLITGTSMGNAVSNIYNTSGVFDPTPEQFAALNADALAKETDSRKVWLNQVRRWAFDEFWAFEVGDERQFGQIKASWMGVVGVEDLEKATVKGSYSAGRIYRNSKFQYNKGSKVYLLTAPDGGVFVMQSYTDHWDPGLTKAGLDDLGTKLKLPAGWGYKVKVLDRDLTVVPAAPDHLALVLQDDLHNTYEGCDNGAACNFTP